MRALLLPRGYCRDGDICSRVWSSSKPINSAVFSGNYFQGPKIFKDSSSSSTHHRCHFHNPYRHISGTMGFLKPSTRETEASDPIVSRLANEDKVPWYRKRNLRFLYFMLFPTCMGIELTSGFDSQMINALQIVPSWISCIGIQSKLARELLLMPI